MKISILMVCVGFTWFELNPPTASAASLDREGAVQYARTHNAELTASRLAVSEARGRMLQAGQKPNPELETTIKPHANGRERSAEFGISQRFPLTARLRLAKSISRWEVTAAEAEIAEAERVLFGDVRNLFVQVLGQSARQDLQRRQHANTLLMQESAQKIADAGAGSSTDALQLGLEAAQWEVRIDAMEADIEIQRSRLRLLLGMAPEEELRLEGRLEEPTQPVATTETPEQPRADQNVVAAKLEAARDSVRLAHAGKWEDISLGIFGEIDRNEDAPNGLQTDQRIGIRLGVPLPLWNRNRGRVVEAEATVARTARELDSLVRKRRSEISREEIAMQSAYSRYRSIEDRLLPQAGRIEEQIRKSRESGVATTIDWLRARERKFELESSRMDALRDYHLAVVRRLTAMGSTPTAPVQTSSP